MKLSTQIKQNLPNALTIARLILSPALLLLAPFSNGFLLFYLLLGASDLLDGFLARRWNVSSRLGARLDSAADFLFCGVLLYILIRSLHWPIWALIWIGAIVLLRLTSVAIFYVRFSQVTFLHSYANKATGFLLLLFPLFLHFIGQDLTMILLSAIASISAIEELLISITSNEFDPNRKSFFQKKPPTDSAGGV